MPKGKPITKDKDKAPNQALCWFAAWSLNFVLHGFTMPFGVGE